MAMNFETHTGVPNPEQSLDNRMALSEETTNQIKRIAGSEQPLQSFERLFQQVGEIKAELLKD